MHLRELISASCQSMAHIAIYVISTSRTIYFEQIHFSNNYYKFAQRKLLLSSDVELHPGPSDMDTVLSAYRLVKIKC